LVESEEYKNSHKHFVGGISEIINYTINILNDESQSLKEIGSFLEKKLNYSKEFDSSLCLLMRSLAL